MEIVCSEAIDEYGELNMIDLTADNIRATAKATGFIKDNVEKVMRLIDILEAVFSTKWRDKLVLKGGTAINMFYMGMPRLSVDIDLDYRNNKPTEYYERMAERSINFIAEQKQSITETKTDSSPRKAKGTNSK